MLEDFRPVFFIIGLLALVLAFFMLIPVLYDALFPARDNEGAFISAAFVTSFIGGMLLVSNRTSFRSISARKAFALTTLAWLILPAFSALPLAMSQDLHLSYTDAFFESMSGLTTTGATVLTHLDGTTSDILLWRSLLQWLGGVGIIVVAVAILPVLQVGGMQLFKAEFAESVDKVLPRIAQIGMSISAVYFFLSFLCAVAYYAAGMNPFDAINHAMTTIATGGYSTHDLSLGYFHSSSIDMVAVFFMMAGALPFLTYVRAAITSPLVFFKDDQIKWFMGVALLGVLVTFLAIDTKTSTQTVQALENSLFDVASVLTGTGYVINDYQRLGRFIFPVIFFLTLLGGCTGSASSGIKMFHLKMLYETTRTQIKRLLNPHAMLVIYYNERPVPETVSASVMGLFFLFCTSFAVLSVALGLTGMDFISALSGAATSLSNVGPGLGSVIGPAGNFSSLPASAKWILSFGMLLGRLDIFTVIVVLSRTFWVK